MYKLIYSSSVMTTGSDDKRMFATFEDAVKALKETQEHINSTWASPVYVALLDMETLKCYSVKTLHD